MERIKTGTVHPTGHCFDDAIEIIEAIVTADPSLCFGNELLLVHALGTLADGRPFSHAWVEMDNMAIFRGIVNGERMELSAPRFQFYHRIKLQQLTRYNCRQVRDLNVESGHFGPWEEPYISLCRNPEANRTFKKNETNRKSAKALLPLSSCQGAPPGAAAHARADQVSAAG